MSSRREASNCVFFFFYVRFFCYYVCVYAHARRETYQDGGALEDEAGEIKV